MSMLWTLVANAEPVVVVAIAVGAAALGLYLGIWLASRWNRNDDDNRNGERGNSASERRGAVAQPSQPDLSDEDEYFELWERLLEVCYHDFRVQAVAGYDRGFFQTLYEPLITEADEDDSPLLPGEIAFGQVRQAEQLSTYWQRRRPIYFQATESMDIEEQVLYRRCLEDAIESLGKLGDQERLYRLVVRTPGRQHIVLLPVSLFEVLCIVPGPPGFDDPYF